MIHYFNRMSLKKGEAALVGLMVLIILFLAGALGLLVKSHFFDQNTNNQVAGTSIQIEEKNESRTEIIPYPIANENDSGMAQGETVTRQEGVNGTLEITYKVTYKAGKEVKREKISEAVIAEAVPKVIAVGTYVAPQTYSYDYNYSNYQPFNSGYSSPCRACDDELIDFDSFPYSYPSYYDPYYDPYDSYYDSSYGYDY